MQVSETVDRIHASLETETEVTDTSLYLGKAGRLLFDFLYRKHRSHQSDGFGDEIQELAEQSIGEDKPFFCGGVAGIQWLYAYLHKEGFLDQTDWLFLCEGDAALGQMALAMLDRGNYDFLHGAVGIGHYLLYKDQPWLEPYFQRFMEKLEALFGRSLDGLAIPRFSFNTYAVVPGEINLGLAHGLPSVLLFCAQCCRQGICVATARDIAVKLIRYMRQHVNADTRGNFFPNMTGAGEEDLTSRLAWCYGDLGAAYALFTAGRVFNDTSTESFSLDILTHSTQRRTHLQTGVNDACVCHGSAGVAHIYNRLWLATGQPVFREASTDWIRTTLGYATHPDGIAGYKTYDGVGNSYTRNSGLLEGVSGIGAVLLGYLTGDLGWDHCFMLNQ
ncbi:MAG TPA: lanthionine synthetase C family protein [Dinghuibacter sp.]|uniref:lanthionine synthetase C family protein n=1 Tax=Dinghuibacter sp. TaxID=2024697 RepID=UPI002B581A0B|nr:lanthionine synthetase C family protein [Dinghuibacter sp.]HTJ11842.1 lanthionine synthetase C family protein [Dinghuibacter sp.]